MMKKNNIKTPSNIYFWWNFGSLISFMMFMQIIFGMLLSMNYFILNNPFTSSFYIYFNLNYGWLMRFFHSNMTSFLFICIFIHMKRSIFFNSFNLIKMWISGMIMLMNFMLISFLGYSLIWTQMSYWGMMVITNFISFIPFYGPKILFWIWGDYTINMTFINRIFIIHFIMPMMLMMMIMIHIIILHNYKSNNPLGLNNKIDMINLNPYSIIKDLMLLIMMLFFFFNLNMYFPLLFNNCDNFKMMNTQKTPINIEPEWYFLFFYSILRSIKNKMNGLILMFMMLFLILFIPLFMKNNIQNNKFNLINKMFIFFFVNFIMIISILGIKIIKYPYNMLNWIYVTLLFLLFFFMLLKNFFMK